MSVLDILSVLAPVFVVIGLGYLGGKRKIFDDHQIEGFNEFVLGFALPAMIFASVLATPRSVLAEDAILFLAVVLVQLVFLVLGVALGRTLLRQGRSGVAGYTQGVWSLEEGGPLDCLVRVHPNHLGSGIGPGPWRGGKPSRRSAARKASAPGRSTETSWGGRC